MGIKFDAVEVSVTNEFDTHIIGFVGQSERGKWPYLIVQYMDDYTDQDKQLNMAEPHIELCAQVWSWYGHIVEFQLSRNRVQLSMDSFAATALQDDGKCEVQFALDDVKFATLRTALKAAFQGKAYFHEIL